MSSIRPPTTHRPMLHWLAWLMLTLAMPVAAQLPVARPLDAPKRVERINPQVRAPVTLATRRADAQSIALASPDLREASRRLKQGGQPPAASLAAVRGVFRSPDRDNHSALLAAGYSRSELIDALKELDKPDAATMAAKLYGMGESPRDVALNVARLYPGLSFDDLFALVKPAASVDVAFAATTEALALGVEQIASTAARYRQSRQFSIGNGRFFPDAETVAGLIRSRHPGTPQGQIWSRLLGVGYEPGQMFLQVAIGDFDRTGRPLDAVAGCIGQRFPSRVATANPTVAVAIAIDGSGSHDARQAECYATFLQSLRTQSISRAIAAQVADSAVACVPALAAACETNRQPVVTSILDGAGYPPERR